MQLAWEWTQLLSDSEDTASEGSQAGNDDDDADW
jgi:hypothetical protein